MLSNEANRKSQKLFLVAEMVEKPEHVPICIHHKVSQYNHFDVSGVSQGITGRRSFATFSEFQGEILSKKFGFSLVYRF